MITVNKRVKLGLISYYFSLSSNHITSQYIALMLLRYLAHSFSRMTCSTN